MRDTLPPLPLLAVFLTASVVLAITPGPGVFYIVSRSLGQGRRAGVASACGVALGNFANAVVAACGLGAVMAASRVAFVSVKYAGAAYLIYLGAQVLRGQSWLDSGIGTQTVRQGRLIRQGAIVALLNPKTALFFAAFVPQFMGRSDASPVQSVALGALFVIVALITDVAYAMAAGLVTPILFRVRAAQDVSRLITGSTFIGLGTFAAFSGTRVTK